MNANADKLPMPEGVDISIPKVWMKSLTGSDFSSLTDPSIDEPTITVRKEDLVQQGAMGDDRINFMVAAHLENLGYAANIAVALAWDPKRFPTSPLIYQSNLKSESYVEWKHRSEYLPKYFYMMEPGEHELVIAVQLREITTKWQYKDEDYVSFTEFPHVGEMVTRTIKVVITKDPEPERGHRHSLE
jgi:hypothetical protein